MIEPHKRFSIKSKLKQIKKMLLSLWSFFYTRYISNISCRKKFKVYWWNGKINFGDVLNQYILEKVMGYDLCWVDVRYYKAPHLIMIGSNAHRANEYSYILGAGYINNNPINPIYKEALMVRGVKSLDLISTQKDKEKIVLADPGLFVSEFYKPDVVKKYKLGIILHYVDYAFFKTSIDIDAEDILIINLVNNDVEATLRQILSCENIISTSLHGLIISDSYKIPNLWLAIDNKPDYWNFKFLDYYSSIDIAEVEPIFFDGKVNISEYIKSCTIKDIPFDVKAYYEYFMQKLNYVSKQIS